MGVFREVQEGSSSPLVPSCGQRETASETPKGQGRDSGSEQGHSGPQSFSLRGDLYRDRLGGGSGMCCGCSHFPGRKTRSGGLPAAGGPWAAGRGADRTSHLRPLLLPPSKASSSLLLPAPSLRCRPGGSRADTGCARLPSGPVLMASC